jgi:hypothetical protein
VLPSLAATSRNSVSNGGAPLASEVAEAAAVGALEGGEVTAGVSVSAADKGFAGSVISFLSVVGLSADETSVDSVQAPGLSE